jgi:hypothetical protein
VGKVGRFLLCLFAQRDVELGLLRVKLEALVHHLAEPLGMIYDSTTI